MNWYNKSNEEIIEDLDSSINGLNSEEAIKRLAEDGLNELTKEKKEGPIKIFFNEFKDPIVILLLISSIFSFIANEMVDGIAILIIILVDAIMGTIEEWRANESANALQKLITVKSKVLRNNKEIEIESTNLVTGDIVLLESGNKISADMRILESRNLTIDESILTGESINSVKENKILEGDILLADRINMLYAGTNVITGRCKAIVIATADRTEIGKIANKVNNTKDTKSPLTIRMEKFSKQISLLIVFLGIIVTILLFKNGEDAKTIFLSVIALSVSAMPEGLPLALTMALTIGSNRMAKGNVIVKKLNSVESLGSCTVIASDKTGTLTVNEQTAKKIILPNNETFNIEGTGYNNIGNIIAGDNSTINHIKELCELGIINNEAKLNKVNNEWEYFGDSIDVAFHIMALKANVNIKNYEVIGNIPYESENKYSATFYKKNDKIYCTVKGSVEKVLLFSNKMYMGDNNISIKPDIIEKMNESFAKDGFRVIAIANGEVKNFIKKDVYEEKDIKDLVFMGLTGFIDPIRKESLDSIKECKNAGIKVVMITGDHPLTAFAIAKELGIANIYSEVSTSDEISKMFDKGEKAFDKYIKSKTVFTRVTPIQKLEIVESYKRQGEFIAVTGDGVNDAPAIKAANIGIAMGSGTDVAKETASMIITDDNFLSIVQGVKEGRNAYSNIRKVVYFLLSCGFAEVSFFILALLFKMEMPLVAIQLLWLNVVTDGLQDFALSFEKEEDIIMNQKPRNTKESVFDRIIVQEIIISSVVISLIVFGLWIYLIRFENMEVVHARGYIMALMVFVQNIHAINCRSEEKSIFKMNHLSNKVMLFSFTVSVMLQIIVMESSILSKYLGTYSISVVNLLKLFALSIPITIVMEIYKLVRGRKKNAEL